MQVIFLCDHCRPVITYAMPLGVIPGFTFSCSQKAELVVL